MKNNEDRVFDVEGSFTLRYQHVADHTLYIDYQCYELVMADYSFILEHFAFQKLQYRIFKIDRGRYLALIWNLTVNKLLNLKTWSFHHITYKWLLYVIFNS